MAATSPAKKETPALISRRETAAISLLSATLGILSGFALFLFWLNNVEDGHALVVFLCGLAVATVLSFILESLREIIEAHNSRWSLRRVLGTIVTIALFELFIIAWHGQVELKGETIGRVLGFTLRANQLSELNPVWSVVAIVLEWVFVAAVISLAVRKVILASAQEGTSLYHQVRRGGGIGTLAGTLGGSVGALGYAFIWRCYDSAKEAQSNYPRWFSELRGWPDAIMHLHWVTNPRNAFQRVASMAVGLPAMVWGLVQASGSIIGKLGQWFGPTGFFLGILASIIGAWLVFAKTRRWWTLLLASPALAVFIKLIPFTATAPLWLLQIVLLAGLIWGIPGFFLGALAPALRHPSATPRFWGWIALGTAGILGMIAVVRTEGSPWERIILFAGCATFLAAGVWFRRGASLSELWPVVALNVGVLACCSLFVVQGGLLKVQEEAQKLAMIPLWQPEGSTEVVQDLGPVANNMSTRVEIRPQPTPDPHDHNNLVTGKWDPPCPDPDFEVLKPTLQQQQDQLAKKNASQTSGNLLWNSPKDRREPTSPKDWPTTAPAVYPGRFAEQPASKLLHNPHDWAIASVMPGPEQQKKLVDKWIADARKEISYYKALACAGMQQKPSETETQIKLFLDGHPIPPKKEDWKDVLTSDNPALPENYQAVSVRPLVDQLTVDSYQSAGEALWNEQHSEWTGIAETCKWSAEELQPYDVGAAEKQIRQSRQEFEVALEPRWKSLNSWWAGQVEYARKRFAGRLEVAMTASTGFWLALGILATWALATGRRQERQDS